MIFFAFCKFLAIKWLHSHTHTHTYNFALLAFFLLLGLFRIAFRYIRFVCNFAFWFAALMLLSLLLLLICRNFYSYCNFAATLLFLLLLLVLQMYAFAVVVAFALVHTHRCKWMVNGKWLAVIFSFNLCFFLYIFLHRYALSQQQQQQEGYKSLAKLTATTSACNIIHSNNSNSNCRITAEKFF